MHDPSAKWRSRGNVLAAAALRSLARYHKLEDRLWHQASADASDGLRALFYKSVWEEAAESVGASVTYLYGSLAEIRCGDSVLRVDRNTTSLDDPVTLRVAGNKPLVYRLLAEHGLPVPGHCVCRADDLHAAWAFVAQPGRRCVVKPARSTGGGLGITTGIVTRRQLLAAMGRAGAYCADVIVEEQIEGGNYRLLYLDGELLDAVERRPPAVRGDGMSTIRHLVEAENADRMAAGMAVSQAVIHVDSELRHTLKASGRELGSVPAADELVVLKTVVNDNRRTDNVPAADRVCRDVVQSCSRAAAAVGARLAGVDVITPDPGAPLAEVGGIVGEVNTTPGYYFHYMTSGAPAPVARLILERLCTGGTTTLAGSS
jgi:D-alanine-D-alanine ligase-like ATP-grasp enzyme